jgi:hypothetical protein
MEEQLKGHHELRRPEPVAKCAGQVRVDGQPPQNECRLFVVLHRSGQLDEAAHTRGRGYQLYALCDAEGNFKFPNGVDPGQYVVSFVELHPTPGRLAVRGSPMGFLQPDELKNLYNDPDKNAKEEAFNLNLTFPGKEDYHFDLAVAGKEGVTNPGSNAIVGRRVN